MKLLHSFSFSFVRPWGKFEKIKKSLLLVSVVLVGFIILFYGDPTEMIDDCDLLSNVSDGDLPQEVLKFDEDLMFDGFNNETGADHFIVPNIIHLIRFNQTHWTFIDYVCILAAFRNHRPDSFYIHTNVPNGEFEGKNWDLIRQQNSLYSIIKILPIDLPSHIFGQKINEKWRLWHGSDVVRLRIMMKYGGIYLDNDVYVIHSLNKYRKFEIALNWDEGDSLGSNVIIANRNARFLPLWLDCYRDYRSDLWYYNAGQLPTLKLLTPHPELIHRVKIFLGFDTDLTMRLYWDKDFPWRRLDSVHLNTRWRKHMEPLSYALYPFFDEKIVQDYEFPFGEMAREVLNTL